MGGHVYFHVPAKRCRVSIPYDGRQEVFWKVKINGQWIPIWDKKTGTKLLSLMQADIDKGCYDPRTYRPDSPLSIKEFSDSWLKTSSATKNTKKVYRNAVNHAIEHFGADFDIREFTHSKLLIFQQSLNLSGSAVYNILTALKTMLRFYQKDVPTFVLPIFPPLTKPEPESTAYLTFDQQQSVLGAIPERHRPIFIIMMEYGLRPQEATALKWDCVTDTHITFKRSHSEYELRETTKSGTKGIRVERITTRAQEAIALSKRFPSFAGWVFCHNTRGSHYDNKILNKVWRTACSEHGINIGLYEAVRHSLGCQLADEGYSIDFIQDVYRHTSAKTTRRYAKRQRGMISDALENRGQVVAFKKDVL